MTGAGKSGVFRAKALEKRLSESFSPDAVAKVRLAPDDFASDIHASAEYRAHLTGILTQRAVAAALAGR
ncbi:hypothetical protein D3C83_299050 [compost metagenome]